MAIYRAQFTIPYFTAIPTDVITNDFHFSFILGSPDDGDYENLRDLLVTFYNTIYNGATSGECMAPWVTPAAASIKIYNVNDPSPRAPRYISTAALTDRRTTDSDTPPEVAICASFKGTGVSGVPAGRQRGRVFIGGLSACTIFGDTSQFPMVDTTLAESMCDAMETLKSSAFSQNWLWVVFSRVGNVGYEVTSGWVDDAFDTQRRRGNAATAREVWP